MTQDPNVMEGRSDKSDDPYSMDIISSAKDAQWSPEMLGADRLVKVISPSKVNLFLSIGATRDDGYHEARNIMHSLALHDTLYFGVKPFKGEDGSALAGPADNIEVRIETSDKTTSPYDAPIQIPVRENLIFKAIDSLAHEIGYTHAETIEVRVEKNIPVQAGLAGGSTDASAALVACARLWGISDDDALYRVAQTLGADVAFFLEGGCCEYTGRGEEFLRRLDPMKLPVVLVKPSIGVSTKEAYETLDLYPHSASDAVMYRASEAKCASDVPLFNSFDEISGELDVELAEVKRWLCVQSGVLSCDGRPLCMLSGSGATTFAITDSFASATRIAAEAMAEGYWARATTFCSLKSSVV